MWIVIYKMSKKLKKEILDKWLEEDAVLKNKYENEDESVRVLDALAKVVADYKEGGSKQHNNKNSEKEINKDEFKKMYFKYGLSDNGHTQDYWDEFYEDGNDIKYLFTEPDSPEATRMFIVSGGNELRMFFMTEESEESFFDYPGKE